MVRTNAFGATALLLSFVSIAMPLVGFTKGWEAITVLSIACVVIHLFATKSPGPSEDEKALDRAEKILRCMEVDQVNFDSKSISILGPTKNCVFGSGKTLREAVAKHRKNREGL